jgi:hypothetical protein
MKKLDSYVGLLTKKIQELGNMEGGANARASSGVDLIGSSLRQGTCDLQKSRALSSYDQIIILEIAQDKFIQEVKMKW